MCCRHCFYFPLWCHFIVSISSVDCIQNRAPKWVSVYVCFFRFQNKSNQQSFRNAFILSGQFPKQLQMYKPYIAHTLIALRLCWWLDVCTCTLFGCLLCVDFLHLFSSLTCEWENGVLNRCKHIQNDSKCLIFFPLILLDSILHCRHFKIHIQKNTQFFCRRDTLRKSICFCVI